VPTGVVLYPVIFLSIFSLIIFVTVMCFVLILSEIISGLKKKFRPAVEFNPSLEGGDKRHLWHLLNQLPD